MEFVNAVLDSIGAIAAGAIGGAAPATSRTCSKKILPLVISFLASVLGLGGICGQDQVDPRGGSEAGREGGRLDHRHGCEVREEVVR